MTHYGTIDHEALRQELVKALPDSNWYLTGATGEVTFNSTDLVNEELASPVIEQHILDAPQREKEYLCLKVDRLSDEVRASLVGDPVRAFEYQKTEKEAIEFKSSEYTGTPPNSVLSWMGAKSWSAKEATDDILRAADQMNQALDQIRDLRLIGKENIRNCKSREAAQVEADLVLNSIKAAFGII